MSHDVRFTSVALAKCAFEEDEEVLQLSRSTITIQLRWPGVPYLLKPSEELKIDINGGTVCPCHSILAIVPYYGDVPQGASSSMLLPVRYFFPAT
jgi:hypothetical protein